METLLEMFADNTALEIGITGVTLTLFSSILLGVIVCFTYIMTQKETYQKSMAFTILIMPAILASIILFVGSDVARAFSLAGTLSIIRFRSAPGEPMDIGFIFFSIACGLACGVGFYGYGLLFAIILSAVIILVNKIKVLDKVTVSKKLKINIPEKLNYQDALKDVFEKYTTKYSLVRVKTTDLGSLFELTYKIDMKDDNLEKEFIDELRTRNGNLNITLTLDSVNK